MAANVATIEDLGILKQELLEEIKVLVSQKNSKVK